MCATEWFADDDDAGDEPASDPPAAQSPTEPAVDATPDDTDAPDDANTPDDENTPVDSNTDGPDDSTGIYDGGYGDTSFPYSGSATTTGDSGGATGGGPSGGEDGGGGGGSGVSGSDGAAGGGASDDTRNPTTLPPVSIPVVPDNDDFGKIETQRADAPPTAEIGAQQGASHPSQDVIIGSCVGAGLALVALVAMVLVRQRRQRAVDAGFATPRMPVVYDQVAKDASVWDSNVQVDEVVSHAEQDVLAIGERKRSVVYPRRASAGTLTDDLSGAAVDKPAGVYV